MCDLSKTKSIRFDAVKEHQEEALLNASTEGLFHKISDFPVFAESKARFNRPKPFDFFFLKDTQAFVIVCFYEPRRRKTCYYIPIEEWIAKREKSEKKSIREPEIDKISLYKLEI